MTESIGSVLGRPLIVINIGLPGFAEDLAAAAVPVIDVAWEPPAGGDDELLALLERLDAHSTDEEAAGTSIEGDLQSST